MGGGGGGTTGATAAATSGTSSLSSALAGIQMASQVQAAQQARAVQIAQLQQLELRRRQEYAAEQAAKWERFKEMRRVLRAEKEGERELIRPRNGATVSTVADTERPRVTVFGQRRA